MLIGECLDQSEHLNLKKLKTRLIEPEQEQLIAFDRQIIHQNNISSSEATVKW